MDSAQKDSPQVQQHSTAHGPLADCPSRIRDMAPRKGAASPVLTVRIPAGVYAVIKAAAVLQGVTVTDLVRDCIVRCFDGLMDGVAIGKELEARKAQLCRVVDGQA